MSRILVIGGYGGFGARLSRRLAAAGHVVLVGGRSAERAARHAATLSAAEAVPVDRNCYVAGAIAASRPALVIDAAGPFQGSGHQVAQACIAARIPYLDLADARDFVVGIGALDEAARAAGVAVVSGASSVPALSGAVARHLAEGLDRVSRVDMAISASNRAAAGASVAAAILSSVGRPMRLWRGGRWQVRHGWQELRRFGAVGRNPAGQQTVDPRLARRRTALCDVPDLDLMPAMLPGRPAVSFRAGTELGFQMWALWLASWPVRWGWLRSLGGAAGWLLPLQRLTRRWGGDVSGMVVAMQGWRGENPVERCWALVAEHGDGPEIPTLAAALLAEEILQGRVAPGARDAAQALTLAQFAPLFAALAIRQETRECVAPPPLYRRVMGDRFDAIPPLVRAMHLVHGDAGADGEASVRRGGGPAGQVIAWFGGFPPAGDYPLHVDFEEADGVERWTRHFGCHRFASSLSQAGGLLVERFGVMRFAFDLPADAHGLAMRLRRWTLLHVPLPLMLAPRIAAREWQEGERFQFSVVIAMPLLGEIVRYEGWLRPVD